MSASYLLDTQVFLWAALAPNKLSRRAERVLSNKNSALFLSLASVWELSIKKGLGKLKIPVTLREFVDRSSADLKVSFLAASLSHVLEVEYLPPHHMDLFDRLLVAQAKLENIAVISADDRFDAYGVKRIW